MAKEDILDVEQLNIRKKNYTKIILTVGILVMILFFVLALLDGVGTIKTPLQWIDYVALGLMALTGPFGFYTSWRYKRTKDIEARLPDFLRDVAEAGRFGMTLAQAIRVSSRGRYGPLTPEIRRMASQIDWGVPASEALRLFADRVDTPLTHRMVSIIIKANDAGGSVADVLSMVAHDSRETMLNSSERKLSMATYTVVIYVSFAVFIATIFIMNATFLPKMIEAGSQVNSAAGEANIQNLPATIQTNVIAQVQLIFVISVVVHAFGDGILAGVLQDGRVSNGMRHSFIMLLIGFISTVMIGGY